MTKREFLDELQSLIINLSSEDVNKYIEYYSEMIDDRMEDGILEEDAVKAVGNPKIIANEILKENGAQKEEKKIFEKVKEKFTKNRLSTLEIILIIVGSPIWISLLAGVFSIVVGVLASIFSVMISLWVCVLAFIVGAVGGILGGIIILFYDIGIGITFIGAGIILFGLAILFFIGSKYLTKYVIYLTKKSITFIKDKIKKGA